MKHDYTKMNRMRIIILLTMAASLLACTKKLETKAFTSDEGRFEVATPIALEKKSQTLNFEDGQVTMYSNAGAIDDVVYAVNYFDIPDQINAELTKQRPGYSIPARSVMIEANGWKVDAVKGDEAKVSGTCEKYCVATGEHFKAVTDKQVIYVRLLWFRNRIYQIMAAHPKNPSHLQETSAQKFAWSFKILPDK